MQVYNPSTGQWEDDEDKERRRREAEAAQSGSTAFSDIPGALYDKKMADLENRYAGVTQMFEDPAAAIKKRIMTGPGEEPDAAPTPVKQTITTDPVTGEQRMKIEGSVQDLTAANPLTPTVSGPAVPAAPAASTAPTAQPGAQMSPAQMSQAPGAPVGPQQTTDPVEIQRRQDAFRAQIAQQAGMAPAPAAAPPQATAPAAPPQPAPPAQPVAPVAAVPGANLSQIAQAAPAPIDPNAPMPAIGAPPVPGPGVQVASTVPGAGVAEAAAAQQAQQAAQVNPAYTPTAERETEALTQEQTNRQAVIDARNQKDPAQRRAAYARLLADDTVDAGTKNLANRLISEDYIRERKFEKANRDIESATETDLARYMREQKKEGSYVKAILLARLGLTKLAEKEMELISPTLTMTSMVDDKGQRYSVELDSRGNIQRAFAPGGSRVGQEEIARLQAAGGALKGVDVDAGVYKDPSGTVPGSYVLERRPGGSVFREVGTNRIASAAESAVLNKTGVQGTLSDQRSRMIQEINLKLQGKTEEEKMAILRPYNQKLVAEGYTAIDPREVSIGAPQIGPGEKPAAAAADTRPAVVADPAAARRAQSDVAGLDREIAGAQKRPFSDPKKQAERMAILAQERAAAQQRVQAAGGGVAAGGGTGGRPTGTQMVLGEAAGKENIQVAGARSKAFNDILDTEVRPQAQAGDTISSTRKQQFEIFDRPGVDMNKIFGLATGAGRSAGDQSWTMIRDVLLGKFDGKDNDIRQRAAALGLNSAEQSALAEYQIANVAVNAANLKKTAGAGSVSDAEQTVNRQAGVDPTKVPALGAYNAMAQSKFDADKARWKADWAENHPATNALQLDKAWRQESSRLTDVYSTIARDRIKYIAENGSTTAAVREGYKRFPIPEYDPQSGQWKKTKPLSSYNR